MFFHKISLRGAQKAPLIEEKREHGSSHFFPSVGKNRLQTRRLELAPGAILRPPVAVVSQGQSLHHSE
jgi:hypothetical protein